MTSLTLLVAGAAEAPTELNPIQLFMDADLVVKSVMAGLILASVWVWTIIVSFWFKLGSAKRKCDQYEEGFWTARDVDAFHAAEAPKGSSSARVVEAGLSEFRLSTSGPSIDREGTRQRVATALDGAVTAESDRLAERLNFLATVGSVAPFVGLFGTVWGIMDSFFNIGAQQNSSLAVVAPGISEALFATAIGLFAAIPAVIAYNRFAHAVGRFETRLYRFSDRFQATLSRELEQ